MDAVTKTDNRKSDMVSCLVERNSYRDSPQSTLQATLQATVKMRSPRPSLSASQPVEYSPMEYSSERRDTPHVSRATQHQNAVQHKNELPALYERLPHTCCQYPGCGAKRDLDDVAINQPAQAFDNCNTPWSISTNPISVTLCQRHRAAFHTGGLHIVRASDDSLTFMRAHL